MMTRRPFLNLWNQTIASISFLSSIPLHQPQDCSAWLVFSKAHIQAALAKFPRTLPNLQQLSWYHPLLQPKLSHINLSQQDVDRSAPVKDIGGVCKRVIVFWVFALCTGT